MVDTRTKLKKYGDDQATKKVEMHISAERLHQQEQTFTTSELGERRVLDLNIEGNRCARAGDYAGAQKLLNMAYDDLDGSSLKMSRLTRLRMRALTLNNKGCCFKRQRLFDQALTALQAALKVEQAANVSTQVEAAETRANIAVVLMELGRHSEALEHTEKALAVFHDALTSQARQDKSSQGVVRAARRTRDTVGVPEMLVVCIVEHTYGICLEANERSHAARRAFRQAYKRAAQELGPAHPFTSVAKHSMEESAPPGEGCTADGKQGSQVPPSGSQTAREAFQKKPIFTGDLVAATRRKAERASTHRATVPPGRPSKPVPPKVPSRRQLREPFGASGVPHIEQNGRGWRLKEGVLPSIAPPTRTKRTSTHRHRQVRRLSTDDEAISDNEKQVTEQECPVDTLPEEEAQGHTDATPEPDTKDDASVVLAQAEKFLQGAEKRRKALKTMLLSDTMDLTHTQHIELSHMRRKRTWIQGAQQPRAEPQCGLPSIKSLKGNARHSEKRAPVVPLPGGNVTAIREASVCVFEFDEDVAPRWRVHTGAVRPILAVVGAQALRCVDTGTVFTEGNILQGQYVIVKESRRGQYIANTRRVRMPQPSAPRSITPTKRKRKVVLRLECLEQLMAARDPEERVGFDIYDADREALDGQKQTIAALRAVVGARAHDWKTEVGLRTSDFDRSLKKIMGRLGQLPEREHSSKKGALSPVHEDFSITEITREKDQDAKESNGDQDGVGQTVKGDESDTREKRNNDEGKQSTDEIAGPT